MKKLRQLTDDELVSRFADGNDTAFDVLITRHKDRVYSYIFSVIKNAEQSEDLFQNLFIKVITLLRDGKYEARGNFGSWLMTLTHNFVADTFRCSTKQLNIITTDDPNSVYMQQSNRSEHENSESQMIMQEKIAAIRALIDKLPEQQREVLLLRFYEEMSFKEIAAAKGCSINTALGRMHYAIQSMRKLMAS